MSAHDKARAELFLSKRSMYERKDTISAAEQLGTVWLVTHEYIATCNY